MTNSVTNFQHRLSLFTDPDQRGLLCCNLRGIERETLRTDALGRIAKTPHPKKLGSALTNPWITTDYSEALLEFITDPSPKVGEMLAQLKAEHQFTTKNLNDGELLWSNSIPGILGDESDIPVADYGMSNSGQMKKIYRLGLGLRYGRKMQTIAGVHFNFSVPDAVWSLLRREDNSVLSLQDYKTEGYLGLIRNFRRWFWLLLYNMGASPIVGKCFVEDREHNLESFPGDEDAFYLPHATSLRMGDLGYQSSAQDALYVCYNQLNSYVGSLRSALMEPYDRYAEFGNFDTSGARQQLSSSILQIENEFYSTVRPKQTARTGETQLAALMQRGIEYVEVRCVDINPFDPLGIDEDQINFLEVFLLACLFEESPDSGADEYSRILRNQKSVVNYGRKPDLELETDHGTVPLQMFATEILDKLSPVAEIMDGLVDDHRYTQAVERSRELVAHSNKTPSARLINEIQSSGKSFVNWTIDQSRAFQEQLRDEPVDPDLLARLEYHAEHSLENQMDLEQKDTMTLEDYLDAYFAQYRSLSV